MPISSKSILFAIGITLFIPIKNSLADEQVLVCGESVPPFYYESDDTNQGQKGTEGLNIDNFSLIAGITGLNFEFTILPWKRCLSSVEDYSTLGDPEIATNATYSAERAEKFHFVGPVYALSSALFYSRNQFPDGPISKKNNEIISSVNEMKDYNICGLLGWNYEMYYTEHKIPRTVKITTTSAGYQGMFNMLSSGRCDVLNTNATNVLGDIIANELEMPQDIACSKVEREPRNFYMMVSKNSPRAHELVTKLSTALAQLQSKGEWKTYTDPGVLPVSEDTKALFQCM